MLFDMANQFEQYSFYRINCIFLSIKDSFIIFVNLTPLGYSCLVQERPTGLEN